MAHSQITIWHEYPESGLLFRRVAAGIERLAAESIARHGSFKIVLAGGSTPKAVYRILRNIQTDWQAWHVYFGDERCLPPDHPDRNSVMADQTWIEHVAIPLKQIHRIPAQLGAEAAASEYLSVLNGVGNFDLVLLGLGQDGHTASLFPGHDWGCAESRATVLAVHEAPKPPLDRVSLSAGRLSCSSSVWFLVTGQDKWEAMQKWRNGESIPAASILPANGVDVWFADVAEKGGQ